MTILLIGCLNVNYAYADSDVIIKVGDATVNADGTYSVPVSIENNPGLAGVMFKLNYDNQLLQVVDVTPTNGLFSSPMINTSNSGIINYVYVAATNEKSSGTLYTVKFKLVSKDSHIGSCVTKLTLSDIDLCDSNLKSVAGKNSDNTINVATGSGSNSNNSTESASSETVTKPEAATKTETTGTEASANNNSDDKKENAENPEAESASTGTSDNSNNDNDNKDNNISKYIVIGAIVIMCGICAAMGIMWYKAK